MMVDGLDSTRLMKSRCEVECSRERGKARATGRS
jgi:hypothetical protein